MTDLAELKRLLAAATPGDLTYADDANGRLLAAAVTALPELCDAVERLTRERNDAREVLRELSADGCEYGDNCPDFAGTRHGTCIPCRCRQALGGA